MADSALAWCSVDRLKEHLSFYKDSSGTFTNTEQDTKLMDCIQGAVSWCAAYTSLPLLKRIKQYRLTANERTDDITSPIPVNNVVGFDGIENAYLVPNSDFSRDWEVFDGSADSWQRPYKWRLNSNQAAIRQDWLIYPGSEGSVREGQEDVREVWPPLANGLVLHVIENIHPTRNVSGGFTREGNFNPNLRDYTAISSAVVLMARDLYDGGGIMERKTTAQHLLDPFRVVNI